MALNGPLPSNPFYGSMIATSCSAPFRVFQGHMNQHKWCCESVRDPSSSSLSWESRKFFWLGVEMQQSAIKEAVLAGRRDSGFSKAASSAAGVEELWKELHACLALQHWHLPEPVWPASGERAKCKGNVSHPKLQVSGLQCEGELKTNRRTQKLSRNFVFLFLW